MVAFLRTLEFTSWYKAQPVKSRTQIDARLENIREYGHYGYYKRLSSLLYEIKFNNGNRIYYTEKVIDAKTLILILGGNKNGQDKDIRWAQKVAEKIHYG
jgi:putative addiction module killer protein